MQIPVQQLRIPLLALAAFFISVWSGALRADMIQITLSGKEAVPPVSTKASGSGTFIITPGKTISGSIKTTGVAGTMAHIHSGKAGKAGPVVVPLEKSGADSWKVPDGAKLTEEAYKAFEAGELYVNVHSAAHPDGELRAQLPAKATDAVPVRSSGGGGGGY